MGISTKESPETTIRDCIFARMAYGIMLWNSPRSEILHNSATSTLYASLWSIYSAKGSRIVGNAFCFSGNASVRIHEAQMDDAKQAAELDYNNSHPNSSPFVEIQSWDLPQDASTVFDDLGVWPAPTPPITPVVAASDWLGYYTWT